MRDSLLWGRSKSARRYSTGNCGIALAVFILLGAPAIPAALGAQVIHGHLPATAMRLRPLGRLAATDRLNLTIELPLQNREALTNLLQQLYDPGSPQFHRYLPPGQFAQQFGPTESDYKSVVAFAKASGFTVTRTHPNRTL